MAACICLHAPWCDRRGERELGQRLAEQAMEVLGLLVEASYARDKAEILATANRKMEVLRWTVRMANDRKRFTAAQFEFRARALNECGRMVGGWLKSRGGGSAPVSAGGGV